MIRNNQQRRRRGGGNNGPRPQQMAGGNNYGPRLDNRQRGNATQLLEKYRVLARDSQQAGDRVTAEYYLQYAEHYFRLLGDYRDRPAEGRRGRDGYDDDGNMDGDGDVNADGGDDAREYSEDRIPRREERPRDDRPRDDRQRDDRPRDDRPRNEGLRDDRPRNDRPREDRPRDDRPRDERPREDRARDDRPVEDRSRERGRRDWQRDRRDGRPDRDESQRHAPEADAVDERELLLQALPPSVARPSVRRDAIADSRESLAETPRRALRARTQDVVTPPAAVSADESAPAGVADLATVTAPDEAVAPKRRGRPRKVVAETESGAE